MPEPTIEWRRADGSPFTSRIQVAGGLLNFKEITAQEEGSYICTAENFAGRVTAQATLKIIETPRLKILQSTPLRVRSNDHVRIECQVFPSEGDSDVKLTWHKLKTPTSSSVGHNLYELPVHPVNIYKNQAVIEFHSIKPTESGIYVCTGNSPKFGSSEERIEVVVEEQSSLVVPSVYIDDKVVTVAAGSRAELRCFVRGTNRNIKIKWARPENKSLPDMSQVENGTLILDKVKPEDGGEYFCQGILDTTIPATNQDQARVLFQDTARLAVVGKLIESAVIVILLSSLIIILLALLTARYLGKR